MQNMLRLNVEDDDQSIEEEKKSDQESLETRNDTRPCFRPPLEDQQEKASHTRVILRALSSSPLQSMTHPALETTAVREVSATCRSSEASIPPRNLSEAFEELYIEPKDPTDTPNVKQPSEKPPKSKMISPTGVADLHAKEHVAQASPQANAMMFTSEGAAEGSSGLLHFQLHRDLKRDLSEALADRVLFYAVIHDINKEALTMASHDDSGYNRIPDDTKEAYDPLVVAVNGNPAKPFQSNNSIIQAALIDEERWLLETIDSRGFDESRAVKACPPTFLQAMGERDYENPLASLSNGSRTQLWKPSRSWWEAKSGKNPWIEPISHNKRWRYLWPLIHYHKFLAKCIKKLKRNGVDVKTSVSPVSVFLREDVCAVSDHLAAVSLFDSEKWMECLVHFKGWIDTSLEAETRLRHLVGKLKLRALSEPVDVDSPLLRSQIDEQYLRAMADARAQLASTGSESTDQRSSKDSSNQRGVHHLSPDARAKKNVGPPPINSGPPPAYPRSKMASPSYRATHRGPNNPSSINFQQPRYAYPPQHPQWYGAAWHAHYGHYGADDNSVQSGLSGDSYAHSYDMNMYPGRMHHPPYFHPMMYHHHAHQHSSPAYDQAMQLSLYGMEQRYPRDHYDTGAVGPELSGGLKESPESPKHLGPSSAHKGASLGPEKTNPTPPQVDGEHSPYQHDPNSPYWGLLDPETLAMMGIISPQGTGAAHTPSRKARMPHAAMADVTEGPHAGQLHAQPLLLRQHHYLPYGASYANGDGYAAASPATQFMMSPQPNFGYGYGAYGGFSPSRVNIRREGALSPMAGMPVSPTTPSKRQTADLEEEKNGNESAMS